ncbi:hypothetical protein [Cupriavidus sp. TMH.W2]|uniref:hypothetical protein n=1 Tax=Cupriavidus sp. TMH.W2 TaxID=3434465 RepID=UPI003D76A6A9
MTQFTTAVQIGDFLKSQGLDQASTGGGCSGWFLEIQGRDGVWQILITDWDSDTDQIQLGRKIGIGLYPPGGFGGLEDRFEIIESAELLPDALERFRKAGEEKFGAGPIRKR